MNRFSYLDKDECDSRTYPESVKDRILTHGPAQTHTHIDFQQHPLRHRYEHPLPPIFRYRYPHHNNINSIITSNSSTISTNSINSTNSNNGTSDDDVNTTQKLQRFAFFIPAAFGPSWQDTLKCSDEYDSSIDIEDFTELKLRSEEC